MMGQICDQTVNNESNHGFCNIKGFGDIACRRLDGSLFRLTGSNQHKKGAKVLGKEAFIHS